ncbi:MAG: Gfo/Idh/MocA family oxidoreductase [Anaerolineales bacterium]|nr:Gfo/Idh/MocA family oxidoreductase [Anaerolineales bacterium]
MSERKLKHVIVGVGATVLNMHRPALALDTVDLVGAMDIRHDAGRERADSLGCPYFTDYKEMIAETKPDVVVVMTPHTSHAEIAIHGLEAGCHVLVEKPIAVQVKEADAMVAAMRRTGRCLAVNFQQRFRPEIVAAHQLIQSGALGKIQHIDMVLSWLRTAAYFRMGGWRASWAGEGGGVLINQSIHDLDILCHLLGAPAALTGWTRTIQQAIETEDTVQAIFRWANGAMGSLFVSTAVGSRPYRLEIVGSQGMLQIGQGTIQYEAYEQDVREFIDTSPEPFGVLPGVPQEIALGDSTGAHVDVYKNLHAAILDGAPLLVAADTAVAALELANGITLASAQGGEVSLPLDRDAYAALLARYIAGGKS